MKTTFQWVVIGASLGGGTGLMIIGLQNLNSMNLDIEHMVPLIAGSAILGGSLYVAVSKIAASLNKKENS